MSDEKPSNPMPGWDMYRALRDQWTHEDNLVNHRVMWLNLSQGLLFTAFGNLSIAKHKWLVIGFPLFGMAVAAIIGISIFAALDARSAVRAQFDAAGLDRLCNLTPTSTTGHRGKWAAQSLAFVFGALWVLALMGSVVL